ncbi:hypothetical protein MMA231_03709 (plasmid) [Asticcacaulis sp. MM231]
MKFWIVGDDETTVRKDLHLVAAFFFKPQSSLA